MEFDLIVEGFNVIGMRLIIKKKKSYRNEF